MSSDIPTEDKARANLVLSMISMGCGIGAYFTNDKDKKDALKICSGVFWSFQLAESFLSPTWGYLNNVMTSDQAAAKLMRYSKTNPEVKLTIRNYHNEKRRPGATVGRPLPPEGVWADRLDQEELEEIQER